MKQVELKLEQDRTKYFYMREETFTVRFTKNISSSSNIIKLLREISEQYMLVQESNYNITLINESMKLINMSSNIDLKSGLKVEAKRFSDLFETDETSEGLTAFVQKRPPKY